MNAIGTIIEFPGLTINSDVKNRYKKPLAGFASWIFNDFIKFSKINVTLIASESTGQGCSLVNTSDSNGSTIMCEGIFRQLQICQSDFSIFPLSIIQYDSRINEVPIINGPQTETAEQVLLSYNTTAETKIAEIGLTKIDLITIICVITSLFLLIFVNTLTIRLMKKRKARVKRHVKTWKPITMSLVVNERNNCKLVKHLFDALNIRQTKSAFIMLLILFMVTSTMFIGVSQTNMILIASPTYFSDVAEAARNETYKIIAVHGLATLAQLSENRNKFVRNMASPKSKNRFVWYHTIDIPKLSVKLSENSANHYLIAGKAITSVAKAYICNSWINQGDDHGNTTPPWFIKMSIFREEPILASYSRCINDEVRKRLDVMFGRMMHSSLWSHYINGAAFRVPVTNENKNYLCITNSAPFKKDYNLGDAENEPFVLIGLVTLVLALGIIMAKIICILEIIIHKYTKKSHRPRPRPKYFKKKKKIRRVFIMD